MPRRIWGGGGDRRSPAPPISDLLERGTSGDRAGLIVGRFIVVLIVTNLVTMTLDSVPALQAQYGPLFVAIELLRSSFSPSSTHCGFGWRPSARRTGSGSPRAMRGSRSVSTCRSWASSTRKGDFVIEELEEAETIQRPAGGHGRSWRQAQCDNMQQTGLAVRSSRVTPPKIHSPNRLCP